MELGDRYLVVQRAALGANPMKTAMMGDFTAGSVPVTAASILAASSGEAGAPTRVLQMLNMVAVEELTNDEDYKEILEDIKEECSKYGEVEEVKIPRPITTDKGKVDIKASEAVKHLGKVVVLFAAAEQTSKALSAIAGRQFGGSSSPLLSLVCDLLTLVVRRTSNHLCVLCRGRILGYGCVINVTTTHEVLITSRERCTASCNRASVAKNGLDDEKMRYLFCANRLSTLFFPPLPELLSFFLDQALHPVSSAELPRTGSIEKLTELFSISAQTRPRCSHSLTPPFPCSPLLSTATRRPLPRALPLRPLRAWPPLLRPARPPPPVLEPFTELSLVSPCPHTSNRWRTSFRQRIERLDDY